MKLNRKIEKSGAVRQPEQGRYKKTVRENSVNGGGYV